MSGTMINTYQT